MIAIPKQKVGLGIGLSIELMRLMVVRLHARAPFNEAAMRNSTISAILAVIFGFSVGSSIASETTMRKSSAEELKSVCDKAGGSFSQDAGGYGCGTNCQGKPGTDCVLACKNDQKACFAQVPGRARPTSTLNALVRSPRG